MLNSAMLRVWICVAVLLEITWLAGCDNQASKDVVSVQKLADSIYRVVKANREVYAHYVVERLSRENKLIKFSEHWQEQKALPVPAQMLRLSAATVASDNTGEIKYSLKSLWAINKTHFPQENQEREGLIYILKNPGKNYYTKIIKSDSHYFMAVYPDVAVEQACIECHNTHSDSPKTDFKKGDLMGGIIVTVKL